VGRPVVECRVEVRRGVGSGWRSEHEGGDVDPVEAPRQVLGWVVHIEVRHGEDVAGEARRSRCRGRARPPRRRAPRGTLSRRPRRRTSGRFCEPSATPLQTMVLQMERKVLRLCLLPLSAREEVASSAASGWSATLGTQVWARCGYDGWVR
jgi:hypothetical protein